MPVFHRLLPAALLCLALPVSVAFGQDWPHYGGDEGGSRFSPLTQINKDNVGKLELAWQYRTGAVKDNPTLKKYIDFQDTPTLLPAAAGGHLVVCDPFGKVIALEPATGTPRWTMDPKIDKTPYAGRFKCRGVEYWADDTAAPGAACAHRLFLATADKRLIAMDARDGRRCADFGVNGEVNVDTLIKATFPADGVQLVQLPSPPTAVNGIVAVSSFGNKFRSSTSVNGAIRGFDARTGALRWTFDPLVRDAATGFEPTPIEVGGGNTWVPMSADSQRDLIFIPTAAPAPNYWGAHRPGDNRYANSIIALRASTGQVVWHFQTLHHDVWDRDVGSPPILVDIRKDGRTIPSVIQLVKTGMVFAFNRETGEPLFPIEERPVPTDTEVVGEKLSPTQPFPTKPPVLVRNTISPDDAWGFTFLDKNACRKKIESMRHGGHYEPISTQGHHHVPADRRRLQLGRWCVLPRAEPARHAGVADSLLRAVPPPRPGGPGVRQAARGRRPDAEARLPGRYALWREAGAPDVAVLHALHEAAVEHAGGGGHGRRRDQVEDPLRQARQADARADSPGPRRTDGRRAHHHGQRPGLYRRDAGQPPARLRRGDRRALVGAHGANVRHVDAHDLRGQRPAVRGLCGGWPLLVRRQGRGRLCAGLCAAGFREVGRVFRANTR